MDTTTPQITGEVWLQAHEPGTLSAFLFLPSGQLCFIVKVAVVLSCVVWYGVSQLSVAVTNT
jgi:hypothetical protein